MHSDKLYRRYQSFSYNKLKECNTVAGYFVIPTFDNQLIINGYSLLREINPDTIEPEDINSTVCVGWKFHIGIYPAHLEDIQKAWDVVKDVVISKRIIQTKVFSIETLQTDASTHSRAITIYAFKEPDNKDWFPIIQELEDTLTRMGVHPAQESAIACAFLPGCRYIQYRCDKKPGFPEAAYRNQELVSDIYIGEAEAVSMAERIRSKPYNPFNLPMPLFLNNLIAELNAVQASRRQDYSKCSKCYAIS